jgi:hypothetical protein
MKVLFVAAVRESKAKLDPSDKRLADLRASLLS